MPVEAFKLLYPVHSVSSLQDAVPTGKTLQRYVLSGLPICPSACRPAPTRHIIASSALEQVFGHLKDEFYRGRDWETFEEFKRDLEAYIHHWNHARRQVRLKGLTPVEFRDQALRGAA
jgi:hypothetical protein